MSGNIESLANANMAAQTKYEQANLPATIHAPAADVQNIGVAPGQPRHVEQPIQYNTVDPRDKKFEMVAALNAQAVAQGNVPPMMMQAGVTADEYANWVMDKAKKEELLQFHNQILSMYDLADPNTKRWFDAKFPFLKQLKLKRIREVGQVHIRLAELIENSDPTPEEIQYILHLLEGKAQLPPPILPDGIVMPDPNADNEQTFYRGLFNPYEFQNTARNDQRDRVVQLLGTNVLGRGFLDRWNAVEHRTMAGPQNVADWVGYFTNRLANPNAMPGIAFDPRVGGATQ